MDGSDVDGVRGPISGVERVVDPSVPLGFEVPEGVEQGYEFLDGAYSLLPDAGVGGAPRDLHGKGEGARVGGAIFTSVGSMTTASSAVCPLSTVDRARPRRPLSL